MSQGPPLLSLSLASSLRWSTGAGTHGDPTRPCPAWCWSVEGHSAGTCGLRARSHCGASLRVTHRGPQPSSWHLFICTRFFSLEPSNAWRGTDGCGAGLRLPSQLLGSRKRCCRGPLPSLWPSGARSEDLTVICLSGGFLPLKGELGGMYVDLWKAGICKPWAAPAKLSSSGPILLWAVSWGPLSHPHQDCWLEMGTLHPEDSAGQRWFFLSFINSFRLPT